MRSIIRNHLEEFLEILEYDKTKWFDFWRSYRKRYGPIVPNYERAHSLTDSEIERILKGFERRFLDRLKRAWESTRFEEKKRISYELRIRSEELSLSREDFVVFLFGGLGLSPWTFVDGLKEKVVLVDVVHAWKEGELGNLPSLVLKAVEEFRKSLGGVSDEDGRHKG